MLAGIQAMMTQDGAWMTVFLIPAVPLHCVVIYLLCKYRKKEFSAHYYVLAISLLINDCFICLAIVFWMLIWKVEIG